MNVYDRPAERPPEEIVELLLKQKNVRIEKIVSDGHTSDWYDQEEDEWVCLLTGEAEPCVRNRCADAARRRLRVSPAPLAAPRRTDNGVRVAVRVY